jgi:hypothetical protein
MPTTPQREGQRARITRLVHSGRSIEDLETHHADNALFRVIYWLSFRSGGVAGVIQDAFYRRYGSAHYWRKINKTRAAFGFPPVPTP